MNIGVFEMITILAHIICFIIRIMYPIYNKIKNKVIEIEYNKTYKD